MRSTLLVLLMMGTILGQRSPLDSAWDLVSKGQRDKAVALLQELIRTEPRNGDARLLLGSLLSEQGKLDEALQQLKEAAGLLPDSAEAHNALGEGLHSAGEIEASRPEFEKAVRLNPKLAQAQCNLGMVLGELGELPAAAGHLDAAIKLMGSTEEAAVSHYFRAKVYTQEGRTDKAMAELDIALKLKPGLAAAWSDLGQARKSQQDDAGALAAFERSVSLDPDDAAAQARLGAEYLHRKQAHQAVAHLERALQLDPADQTALFNLQIALRQDGREEEARDVSAKLAALIQRKDQGLQNNLTANRLNNEGVKLQQAGDLRGALAKYSAAHELNPDSELFLFNMAVTLLRVGRWKEGLAALDECRARDPNNAKLKAVWDDAIRQAPPGSWVAAAPSHP